VRDSLFIKKLLEVCPLPEDDQALNHEWHKVGEPVQNLVSLLLDVELALLVLLPSLEHEVDALKRLGLELVDQVVQSLKTSDVDDAVVVW